MSILNKFFPGTLREAILMWDESAKKIKFVANQEDKSVPTEEEVLAIYNRVSANEGDIAILQQRIVQQSFLIGVELTDDYQLPLTEDMAPENIELVDVIPAFAKVLSIQVRNVETFTSSGALTTLVAGIGTATGTDNVASSATVLTEDELLYDAILIPQLGVDSSLWISDITPDANWSTLTAGKLEVVVTYLKQ